jgi:Uri superfamily endonuclease
MLDETTVEIAGVTVIRAADRIESDLARRLAGLPGATPLVAGLGASDARGETHLVRLRPDPYGTFPYVMETIHDIMR